MSDSNSGAASAASPAGIGVLVCGGRDFADRATVWARLDRLHAERGVSRLIHGDARGADTLAMAWAMANRIHVSAYPANWAKHGKAAGPIRNQQMLDEAKPDLVIAFPGGRGTADMVKRAKASGCPVEDASKTPKKDL